MPKTRCVIQGRQVSRLTSWNSWLKKQADHYFIGVTAKDEAARRRDREP
jgi:hypothetical protein